MKSIHPYIMVENCKEAMEFYEEVLGGEIKNVQALEEHGGKYMHAELHMSDQIIHFSDVFQDYGKITQGNNVYVLLEFEEKEEIKKVYESIQEGAEVGVELQETFWGALHANLIDRYGIGWMLNCQL
ncbi:VOC family protein [Alteribacillus bidgolensis]|uniref:PhnB protein n=1 Tax=Alteribacillus bidgolensis TaxID=930129 RepID=A0A1G8JCS2_9BACI|nr:glyoxalase/bleomycin resistance/extradiol dioxygenase family protein [Alteribacillus bidgolensis]SDI29069.1 PhnB protein [Alteribacillus bidgolensis]